MQTMQKTSLRSYQSSALSKTGMLIWSACYATIIILVCLCYDKNFFNIDDNVNGFIGYYTQYGRIWSQFSIPLIVDSLLYGGNSVVEIEYQAFLPQTIVASFLAWHGSYKQFVGIFLAFFNIILICISCLAIGRVYNLSRPYTCALAAFCAIQPFFLFYYCTAWWNSANGQAWLLAAIASFLLLARKISLRNLVINFLCVTFLLLTIWAYSIIAYAIFALIFIVLCRKKFSRPNALVWLFVGNFLAAVFTLPVISEYIYESSLHDRFSKLLNNNFLMPPLSSIVMSFSPAFYDFITSFRGPRLMVAPLAFSTIFIPLVLFKRKYSHFYQHDYEIKVICIICIFMFLLAQSPEFMGPTRWSIRYVPILSFFICLAVFYFLNNAPVAEVNKKSFFLFLAVCFIFSISKTAGYSAYLTLLQALSLLLICIYFLVDKFSPLIKGYLYPLGAILSLLIMIAGVQVLEKQELWFIVLPNKLHLPKDLNQQGFTLRLGASSEKPGSFVYIAHSRGGINNIRTVNGYSPLGYKNAVNFLPFTHSGIIFESQKTLDNLLQKAPDGLACRALEWRISSIILPEAVERANRSRLEGCGYRPGRDAPLDGQTYVSLPPELTKGWEDLPPYAYPWQEGIKTLRHSNNGDEIFLPARTEPVKLVFPRLWWRGYSAYMNGEKLSIGPDETGMLVQVDAPAGQEAVLELSYFPVTWRYLWPLPLCSLIGLLWAAFRLRKREINGIWSPAN